MSPFSHVHQDWKAREAARAAAERKEPLHCRCGYPIFPDEDVCKWCGNYITPAQPEEKSA